jgi:hypothetical protein
MIRIIIALLSALLVAAGFTLRMPQVSAHLPAPTHEGAVECLSVPPPQDVIREAPIKAVPFSPFWSS